MISTASPSARRCAPYSARGTTARFTSTAIRRGPRASPVTRSATVASAGSSRGSSLTVIRTALKICHRVAEMSTMRSPRILLADDAPEVRALLSLVLGRAGAGVRRPASGAEALDLVQEADAADAPFDAILLDGELPGVTAMEPRLRARGCTAPVMVLQKPTRPEALLAALARCLASGLEAGAIGFQRGGLAARGARAGSETLAARFAEGLPADASALEGALAHGDAREVAAIARRLE